MDEYSTTVIATEDQRARDKWLIHEQTLMINENRTSKTQLGKIKSLF